MARSPDPLFFRKIVCLKGLEFGNDKKIASRQVVFTDTATLDFLKDNQI